MTLQHLNWHQKAQKNLKFSDKLADSISTMMGSWGFIIIQTIVIVTWIGGNVWLFFHFDPFPFIFLNLAFSAQAAYATPIIMMSQNRSAARDKIQAEHQYEHQEQEILKLIEINTKQMQILEGQNAILDKLSTTQVNFKLKDKHY